MNNNNAKIMKRGGKKERLNFLERNASYRNDSTTRGIIGYKGHDRWYSSRKANNKEFKEKW